MKHYDVEINGTRTTLLLSDADARVRGLEGKERKATTNKARRASNKAKSPTSEDATADTAPAAEVVAGAGADSTDPDPQDD